MPQPNDLSRSLVALDQNSTIIAVIEMSQSSWLVAGMLPGIERQPRKKLEPNPERLLGLLHRWRDEAVRAGRTITRIALVFEAGCDGFWLARWLAARGVEAHVIHPSSVAVSREHRWAKTDRLDTELLKRGFLGWLRGERGHCSMARVPTIGIPFRGSQVRNGLAAGGSRIRTLGPPWEKNADIRSLRQDREIASAWRGLVRPVHQLLGRSATLRNLTAG